MAEEEVIEIVEDKYAKFKHPKNGAYYAFVELPLGALDTFVPEQAKWALKPAPAPTGIISVAPTGSISIAPTGSISMSSGCILDQPVYVQKTLMEFVLSFEINKELTKTIIPLAAMERPTIRTKKVNRTDISEWDYYLEMVFGKTIEDWMTIEEYQAKMSSEEYGGE